MSSDNYNGELTDLLESKLSYFSLDVLENAQ